MAREAKRQAKPRDLWQELCSKENLFLAYQKARKHKTTKSYVLEFEKNLKENLSALRIELLLHSYRSKPLESFIIRDPKTRKISKSEFRDRIVHHALCNIIEPIFDKGFIYDSYANRKRKGTLKAIARFDYFKRKCSRNFTKESFVLKADIRKYFDNVSHNRLIEVINKKIKDKDIINLISTILSNHNSGEKGKGMPLGNLTSQFFANVYLNELDQYVKHELKAKYYIRYVDDFIILSRSRNDLTQYQNHVDSFLKENLKLELHPEKSKISPILQGTCFLGFREYTYHMLLKRSNLQKFKRELKSKAAEHQRGRIKYNEVYDFLEGWLAYAKNANTFSLRKRINKDLEELFCGKMSDKEINRLAKLRRASTH